MLTNLLTLLLALTTPVTDSIPASAVIAAKQDAAPERLAVPVSAFGTRTLDAAGIKNPKGLSDLIPGLHMPDYGASLTSTIYLRGFGSRMENPVMGLYVDDIPVLDKNAYDIDFLDLKSATMLRGPQGTGYGRNTMCGVLSLRTLAPGEYDGLLGRIEGGTAGQLRTSLSWYGDRHALSLGYRHGDGWFDNACTGAPVDPYDGGSLRWRWERRLSDRLSLSNSLSASLVKEGAFAYGQYREGVLHPVSYNDEGSYARLTVLEGAKASWTLESLTLDAAASLQWLSDDVRMDNDYTARDIFTLEQRQDCGAGTLDLTLRPTRERERWQPATGLFAFFKGNHLSAPVHFKEGGIQSLILDNANGNIPADIGYLDIRDRDIPILSEFRIRSWGAALYHESVFRLGRWQLTAGVRLDYEGGWMGYDCSARLDYRFVPFMASYKAFRSDYRGSLDLSALQLLPKLSALYEVPSPLPDRHLFLYATASKGWRAGGFNTQIFSDILQNRMMNGLMEDLGVYLDRPAVSVGAENTRYAPETAWNYEIGGRLLDRNVFRLEASLYYIDGRNQQLTVFPPGLSTGRMMTNAGRSRSLGAEAEADLHPGQWTLHLSYGCCDARFVRYDDGNHDYSGNRIPYSPAHTLYAAAGYRFPFATGRIQGLSLLADLHGTGGIRWDEANTLSEPFAWRLGGRITLEWKHFDLYLRGSNLTDDRSRTFYFKSVGNEFFALSKPRALVWGLTLKI
ncbi:MAG: TonB-dependent receptor [Bacteroidales bacterium]|nr:TonB-dependent receptor [Bacteroidales bacterium]